VRLGEPALADPCHVEIRDDIRRDLQRLSFFSVLKANPAGTRSAL